MKQINLYQAEFRPARVVLPARALLLSSVVFLIGLIGLYVWQGWQLKRLRGDVAQVVERADAVSRQVRANAPSADRADANLAAELHLLETRVRGLQLAQEAIASGELGSESGYSAQFRALSRAAGSPPSPGAWLTGVTISESGRALDLRGRALTGADSARLIASLRREPLFVGLSFASLNVHAPEPDAEAAEGKALKPARFLEFSLNARPSESGLPTAPGATAKAGRS
ncbi:MAG: hypothetical protein B7Y41_02025 [Hydrogenophilales bacterium 28-61-23]|nr:MAG: hypothetical protein B7Y41_02025 [Hydrogenophilales bacterium 28-61-23]